MSNSTNTPETVELVEVKIDGREVSVPKGTLIIRAAEQAGIRIPRFCDHPLLKPVGACRQCLVQVAMPGRDGVTRPMPKPQPSCAMTVSPGMEIETQHVNEMAAKAQAGVMEFLLINHPLDCPICDKAGECPLQNQAMSEGRATSRFQDVKRTFPKPVALTSQILLDRDRCVLCQRCTRFVDQIPGDRFIALQGRGGGHSGYEVGELNGSQIGTYDAKVLNFAVDVSDGSELQSNECSSCQSDPFGRPSLVAGYANGQVSPEMQDRSKRPFSSYFGGNIIQICPVGALTSQAYRFRSRPFDLVSTPSISEHDSSGSAIRVDVRRGQVLRRQAGNDPQVNEEWITDKDRFAFGWQKEDHPLRLHTPLVRGAGYAQFEQAANADGAGSTELDVKDVKPTAQLEKAAWSEALALAAEQLKTGKVGFWPGGRLPIEDAYAWAKFARVACATNDIDSRVRDTNCEELKLIANLAGSGLGVTYNDLETASQVLLVGFEPEEEVGSVFLRLRKGVRAGKVQVAAVSQWLSPGNKKLDAELIMAAPNQEAEVLTQISTDGQYAQLAQRLAGGVILIGERAATSPGLLTAAVQLAERVGAKWQWIARRVGERSAVEMGALPNLLPYGRPVSDAAARVDLQTAWNVDSLPADPGRSIMQMCQAVLAGELDTLVIGGVGLDDLPDPQLARQALSTAKCVISLEVRRSAVTDYAHIVLPVAPPVEKGGTYVNWEGRLRPFGQTLVSHALADREVINLLAEAMGVQLNVAKLSDVHQQLNEIGAWDGTRLELPGKAGNCEAHQGGNGEVQLAAWRLLLDDGDLQQDDQALVATGRRAVARVSQATAEKYGLDTSGASAVTISGIKGQVTLPLVITQMPEQVVWVPLYADGCHVYADLGLRVGQTVSLQPAQMEVTK